ncbi:YdcF family protein [Nocardiopsis alkaliphila]|uniref:YdcF family protein n=1 Tax=Nocardiopsis alkaliphila TaxID=225762 RepID=UPI000349A659|nr:YdcF family protein [Nocardiopsis alkaliphila]
MRTASNGRDDEAWNGSDASSADDEATRVFRRDDLGQAATGADVTREFTFDPTATRALSRDVEAGTTREFGAADQGLAAPAESGEGQSAFTRKFVRERPRPRSRPTRPVPFTSVEEDPRAPWPPADEPFAEDSFGAPEPRTGPRRGGYGGGRGGGHGEDFDEAPPPRRPRRRERRPFRLRRLITFVVLIALAIPPATWGWVWYTARQDDRTPSDAIIVLGASQYNGVPSPVFEAPPRQAQVLYLDGVAPVIITVGGKQPDDNYTEAAAGRNWLVEVGIPAEHVVAVEEGSDTLQSFQAVAEVYESNQWETAILVSDPWHSLRTKVMAGDHGIEAGTSPARSGPAVIERRTQLWYITRETASLWYYWIFNDSSDIKVNAA